MKKVKIFLKKIKTIFDVVSRNYIRVNKILWNNDKKVLLLSLFKSLISSITPIINAFIYGAIIDLVISSVEKKTNIEIPLIILISLWFVIYFISTYLNTLSYIIWQKVQLLLNKIYTKEFLEKINNVGIKTLYDKDFYDYFNKAQEQYQIAAGNVGNYSSRINTALLSFVFSIIVFFYFSPIIGILVLLSMIPTVIYEINFSKMSWGIWSESKEYRNSYYSLINIFRRNNSEELKIHNTGEYLKEKVVTLNNQRYEREMSLTRKRTSFNLFGSFLDTVIYIFSSVYIIYEALAKIIPIGSIVTFFSILGNYIASVQYLISSFIDIYESSLYLDDIHQYLEFELKDDIINGEIKIKNNKQHKIEFKNVSFKYPQSKKYIFKDLSLTIEPGEKIAIIGENGAGKSTFINLLCRFYDVNSGEILIDGINIKDIDILSWYNNIGILFQDYIKYNFSAKENIYLGDIKKKDNNLKDIIKSSKKGGSHKFIQNLNNQYDTILNNIDTNLSGGQWQKLALSREFFRDPEILILDEPTSNLDAKAENEIFKIIENTAKGKTVILISHRFSTVRNANKIFVFEKGKILEEGNHQELMKLEGKYAELFNLQAKGYRE